MAKDGYWTVNRTQVIADLWQLGFTTPSLCLVFGQSNARRVSAKVAKMKMDKRLPSAKDTTFNNHLITNRAEALLIASAQLTADTRTRLLATLPQSEETKAVAMAIVGAFIDTTRYIGSHHAATTRSIVMHSQLAKAAELLEIQVQATAPRLPEHHGVLVHMGRRLAAFIDVIHPGDPS